MNGLKKKREQVRPGEGLEMSGHAKQLGSPGGCRKLLRVEKKRNAISLGLLGSFHPSHCLSYGGNTFLLSAC